MSHLVVTRRAGQAIVLNVAPGADPRYKCGQRLVIKREAVSEALTLVEQLTHGIREDAEVNG